MRIYFVQERTPNGKWGNVKRRMLMPTFGTRRDAKRRIARYVKTHAGASTASFRILGMKA